MPDDFVDKVKSGVRDIATSSPFLAVGDAMAKGGETVMNEYHHYRKKFEDWRRGPAKPAAKPATKRSMAARRR